MLIKYITRKVLEYLERSKALNTYSAVHHRAGVEYLKSKGRDFGSPFAYKQKAPYDGKGLRVAVCLSGFLRTYEKTAHAFVKNVLEPLNADLFIYTPSKKGVSWELVEEKSGVLLSREDRVSEVLTMEKIAQHYPRERIKKCEIWEYDEKMFYNKYFSEFQKTWDGRDYRRVLSFFYHIEKCNELKKEYEKERGFEYDIVIRLRGDLAF